MHLSKKPVIVGSYWFEENYVYKSNSYVIHGY